MQRDPTISALAACGMSCMKAANGHHRRWAVKRCTDALVASPPHAVLPLGVQMQLRRAALNNDISALDRSADTRVQAGLVRSRSDCAWMTRAEIGRTLAGLQGR